MTTAKKLKMLKLSLHYIIPKLRSSITGDIKIEDLPLFIEV